MISSKPAAQAGAPTLERNNPIFLSAYFISYTGIVPFAEYKFAIIFAGLFFTKSLIMFSENVVIHTSGKPEIFSVVSLGFRNAFLLS